MKLSTPMFCCMSQEEIREYELECNMQAELAEMYQLDSDDLFEAYGVESRIEAEEIITGYYRETA